ncbi:flagellar biosynthetic protein FliR [Thalassobius sp. S69A]|uniref:flagellar biosynthetic protein FliR n=1 Tax=unclassified Thalassovita TaxID=2619711 RepID=UPI000C122A02|nr:flagellar biosynthesis protein FliR [Paracoccaceae bacterium]MBT26130.1 flagellar biosynthesis protein FliR [Paracoccaceae bacterium]
MNDLAQALDLSQEWLWHGFLVFLRVGAIIWLVPGFGEQSVPVRVKLALAIASTMVLAPLIPPFGGAGFNISSLAIFLMTETVAGLLFGIGLRLFVMALQTAGTIAAQSTSLSQILGNTAEPMPAIGHVLLIGGLALAMLSGVHVKFLAYTLHSYDLIAPGTVPDGAALSEWGLRQIADAFALAFRLSAPFIVVSLLYNLTLGAINRAMPQLMVAFVGAPAITAAGMVLLALLSPSILIAWRAAMEAFLLNPAGGLP